MPHNPHGANRCHSAAEIADLVRQFEDCTIAPAEFSHDAHLLVALWYVGREPLPEAAARMRAGLLRFIAHNQVDPQKYHETITLFWLKLVGHFLASAGAGRPRPALAQDLLARFGDSQLLFAHYSRELIASPAARSGWVAPDLRPLDFD